MSLPDGISRRAMWAKLGVLFNGAVGLILAAPIVRYLLSPVLRRARTEFRCVAFPGTAGSVSGG